MVGGGWRCGAEYDSLLDAHFKQVLMRHRYNEKVDVFSFSFVLLEIVLSDSRWIRSNYGRRNCQVSATRRARGCAAPCALSHNPLPSGGRLAPSNATHAS